MIDDDTDAGTPDTRHRSPGLILLGIAALLVAGWGLAGGPDLPPAGDLGWIAVAVGLAIGLLLIVTGARSSRRR
ncbi:hypothetical protein GIY30_17065 [Gordonia sp. HNM0687]|uniref:Uncharacterized protein n=1 Tax=Gordonia mangrovi TaxID=2665643 RepID=A0A6L7GT21_9ACTN|nr:hypothetical protein [Gordonia mangrovi]MDY6807686.1 hypothetical protein [Actinomycetota bacterium]MXP23050.1 hypothetical protein [Gordonia mangrovi]UVF77340.1 hypothetical protein NWF22_18880 [Gordonia mangrovi]